MIEPHGGELVSRVLDERHAEQVRSEVEDGPSIQLDWSQYQDALNLATGRFSPLEGFLTRSDFLKVLEDVTLEDGTVWPFPVTLDVGVERAETLEPGERAGLRAPDGELIGAVDVEELYRYSEDDAVRSLFGTTDDTHPGVAAFRRQGPFFVGGPVSLFEEERYNEHDLHPVESRVLFRKRDWDTVVGFQTRNVPHRAHEYIQKSALELVDGLLVQPKLGEKKVDDYRDETILGGYRTLIEEYYPDDRVALSVYPSRMHYAGPREAVLDAIVRKNQGCTHFVVGRDHAGVGDYYGEFEAQRIFDRIGDVGIETLFYEYSFYCHLCDGMTSEKVCPHDESAHVYPSGTAIREKLRSGSRPSEKVMRPEVAEYLERQERPFVEEVDA